MSIVTAPSGSRVADRLRGLMAEGRVPQKSLAGHLGVSQSYLSRRLTGQVDFKLSELEAIAAALDVPLTRLLGQERAA